MFSIVFSVLVFFGVYDMCRSKLERDKDRDVSEKIALGLPSGPPSQESLFDQRLFGQSKVGRPLLCSTCVRSSFAGA